MPTTFTAILVIIVFVIPGFIFLKTKEALITLEKKSEFDKIIGCIIGSSLVYTLWSPLLIKGYQRWYQLQTTIKSDLIINYLTKNWMFIILIIWITPVILALLDVIFRKNNLYYKGLRKVRLTYKTQGTEVWDNIFGIRENKPWVRIYVNDERIYQGIATEISVYPFEKQIYITNVKILDKDGTTQKNLKGAEGVYINAKDVKIIEIYK